MLKYTKQEVMQEFWGYYQKYGHWPRYIPQDTLSTTFVFRGIKRFGKLSKAIQATERWRKRLDREKWSIPCGRQPDDFWKGCSDSRCHARWRCEIWQGEKAELERFRKSLNISKKSIILNEIY